MYAIIPILLASYTEETLPVLMLLPTISRMILAFYCSSASLETSLNTCSILNVLPAVSGIQKKVNRNASKRDIAKIVYALVPMSGIRGEGGGGGLMSPYRMFQKFCCDC